MLASNTVLATCAVHVYRSKAGDRIHSTQSGVKFDQITDFVRCIRLFDCNIGRQFVFIEDVI